MTGSPENGLVIVVKRSCPTCELVAPVVEQLAQDGVTVYSQDDPSFPEGVDVQHDSSLEVSYRLGINIVPTLVELKDGRETRRQEGWLRSGWEEISGTTGLGVELPAHRPGCGSLSVEPGNAERLEALFGNTLQARRIEFGDAEDEHEALFERGWTDGLPVVPPTPKRVLRMLQGTERSADEVVGQIPPNLAPCTVEKAAVNAVMAGCRPEYLPVVLATVEAACKEEFCMHGLLATTMSNGPVVLVNGPAVQQLGMATGINVLGQGNRANATIGRALQLIVRNVGGGRPGEVDRACFGHPGKYTFCLAENEEDSPWESFAVERGFSKKTSTVTLFPGEGPRIVVDQLSRTPDSLTNSFAACIRTHAHPKLPMVFDVMLVVSPEHARVFNEAGWDKNRLRQELVGRLMLSPEELARGANDMAEGVPESMAGLTLPKVRPEGLLIVYAGGPAGLFSAIIGGWVNSDMGSDPVTVAVKS